MKLTVEMTEKQLKSLMGCLDLVLRAQGVEALVTVVDLYNLLNAARPVPEETAGELTDGQKVPEGA